MRGMSRYFLCLFLYLRVGFLGLQAQGGGNGLAFQGMLIEAERFMLMERWTEAKALLEDALAEDETQAVLHYKYAQWHGHQGQYDKALEHMSRALALSPENPHYYVKGISFAMAKQDVYLALDLYARLRLRLSSSAFFYTHGEAVFALYLGVGEWKQARELLDGWEAEAGISEASLHRRVKLYRPWGKGALLLETLGRLATDFEENEAYLLDYAKALWEAEDWADSKAWRETRWYVWCDKVSGSSRFLLQMYFAEALFSFNVAEAERRMGIWILDRRISGRLKREALRRGFPLDFSTPADSLRGAAYMRLGVLLSMESPKDAASAGFVGFYAGAVGSFAGGICGLYACEGIGCASFYDVERIVAYGICVCAIRYGHSFCTSGAGVLSLSGFFVCISWACA